MQLCSENHEEICFDSQHCPLCEALKEKSEAEEREEDLRTQINDWKDVIDAKETEATGMAERIKELDRQIDELTHL